MAADYAPKQLPAVLCKTAGASGCGRFVQLL